MLSNMLSVLIMNRYFLSLNIFSFKYLFKYFFPQCINGRFGDLPDTRHKKRPSNYNHFAIKN